MKKHRDRIMRRSGLALLCAAAAAGESRPGNAAPAPIIRGIYCAPGPALDNRVWRPYGAGYARERRTRHSGHFAIRCANARSDEAHGAVQTIRFHQSTPRPLVIAGWARLQGVPGKADYHCSIYLDLTLADGKSWPMKIAAFDPARTGWQYAEKIYQPPAPLASARVYVFLREKKGIAWFDDLYVGEILDARGTRSPNRLQNPGFETRGLRNSAARKAFFQRLRALGCNAFHFYRGIGWNALMRGSPDQPPPIPPSDPLPGFIRAAHQAGFRVWLTVGAPHPPRLNQHSPEFPFYACVNGPWGAAYTRAVAYFAQSGADGIGTVPDEWTYSNGRLKRAYARSRDPVVAAFYRRLPLTCDCPVCRTRFKKRFNTAFPDVRNPWSSPDPAWARLLQFRYDSTAAWIARTVRAVKAVNPRTITDTMICVLPVCSDDRIHAGAAWDEIGARTGLDCLQTDPYIFLHNYLGDSTHYYPTETILHLAAANFPRRAGVTLEACRLRPKFRKKDPAELYGTALSCLVHGAREFFWWHLRYLEGKAAFVDPAPPARRVRAFYELVQTMEPDLRGAAAPGDILVLYSRRSEDTWDWLARAKADPEILGKAPDRRRGFLAHKNLLYWLLRRGIPFRMTFLEHPAAERIRAARALLVPFPFALSKAEAAEITSAARAGKTLILMDELAPFDKLGQKRPRPWFAPLFAPATPRRTDPGPNIAQCGRGKLVFLGNDFARRLFAPCPPVRDPKAHVPLARFEPGPARVLAGLLRTALGRAASVFQSQPEGDVEAAVVDGPRGRLLMAIDWDARRPFTVAFRQTALRGARRAAGVAISPPRAQVSHPRFSLPAQGPWRLKLQPQQAMLLRLE